MKKVEYPKDASFSNLAQAQKFLDEIYTRAERINSLPIWRLVKHYKKAVH